MKKRSTKGGGPATQPAEPSHLEDSLTRFVQDTAHWMKRWRYQLLVVVAIAVAGGIALSFLRSMGERKIEALNRRVYALLDGPLAQAEGYVAPEDQIDQLLADSRGQPVELPILVRTTHYYLDRAIQLHDELTEEAKRAESAAETGDESPDSEKPDPQATKEKTAQRDAGFAKVRSLVEEAETRFEEPRIIAWAASVRAKIDGLLDDDWRPPSRTYAPPLPAASTETVGDEASTAEKTAAEEESGDNTTSGQAESTEEGPTTTEAATTPEAAEEGTGESKESPAADASESP